MTASKPVRVWCITDPQGKIRRVSNIRRDCCSYVVYDRYGSMLEKDFRRELNSVLRQGWSIRRLRPEEVST